LWKGRDTDDTSDTSSQASNNSDKPRLDKGKGKATDDISDALPQESNALNNNSDTSSQASNDSDKPKLDKGKGKATDNTVEFNYTKRPKDTSSEEGSNKSEIFDSESVVTMTKETEPGTPNPEFSEMIRIFRKLRTGQSIRFDHHSDLASEASQTTSELDPKDSAPLLSKVERKNTAIRPRNSETEFKLDEVK
jgi:hypothetical protein